MGGAVVVSGPQAQGQLTGGYKITKRVETVVATPATVATAGKHNFTVSSSSGWTVPKVTVIACTWPTDGNIDNLGVINCAGNYTLGLHTTVNVNDSGGWTATFTDIAVTSPGIAFAAADSATMLNALYGSAIAEAGGVLVRVGAPTPTATATATPTAAPLVISSSDVSVTEGDSGTMNANFTVRLSGTPSNKVEIRANTLSRAGEDLAKDRLSAGPSGAGTDFKMVKGMNLVFESGASGNDLTKTVTVTVLGDQVKENNETFTLRLNNLRLDGSHVRANDSRVRFAGGGKKLEVTGTIVDDDQESDTGHVISVSDVSVNEGNSGKTNMSFTVTLSASPSHRVQLKATAIGNERSNSKFGTPTATGGLGEDFYQYFKQRLIVFEAGATGEGLSQTVAVTVFGDTNVEPDETLTLWLNNLSTDDNRVHFSNGSKVNAKATGTITNDD